MKNRYLNLLLSCLSLFCISLNASGISYQYTSDKNSTSIHILVVNPLEHLIIPVRASGEDIQRETVETLAKRYGAIAAINGGFWKINGSPAGALKINNEWMGTPVKPRGAIGWSSANQNILIDRVLTNYQMNTCPPDCRIEVIPAFSPPYTNAEDWNGLEHIVGGTPVLLQNRHPIKDFTQEQTVASFLINRHARTAVGFRDNGDWVFVVVDSKISGGMDINELSELMLSLGCIEALNLDGGGSSTMVIEGEVVNQPCGTTKQDGKFIEAVSDAIIIF